MPRTAEHTVNVELARLLRTRHPRWRQGVGVEQSGVLSDAPAQRPDILIRHPGGLPVVIETEFQPARGVEQDARGRLGATVAATGEVIEQGVALRVPVELRSVNQARLPRRVAAAAFDYCVFTEGAEGPDRWPARGWLTGGVDDLAGFIEQTALSERRIARGTLILETGVRQAAGLLQKDLQERPDAMPKIAAALHQQSGEQTMRMAMAIVANALTFQTGIAASHDVPALEELRNKSPFGRLLKSQVVGTWRYILGEINYWPIFRIASDIVIPIPDATASAVLNHLARVAEALHQLGAATTHDLSGQMFGRLIADRKFLATFYTLPASASLLAELAAARLDLDWSDPEAFTRLQVADLACGSGALLAAAYRAVTSRHRRAGGDDAPLHASMMEHALIGADIMPAATHLTAATLSSAHPTETFDRTRIHTMPYGDPEPNDASGRATAIGSLDLILSDAQPSLFGTGQHVIRGHDPSVIADALPAYARQGDELRIPHDSVDLMIMNPPFTRPLGHEGVEEGVPVSSFAGFNTSADEQRAMSTALRRIRSRLKHPAGHGYAGLASNFIDLAHAKVKPGGVLALVLPLAVVSGEAWASARRLLAREYRDITFVTIAATGDTARAFSSDTTIGEALVIATRRNAASQADDSEVTATYVNLLRRPRSLAESAEIARTVRNLPDARAGLMSVGDTEAGCFVRATAADGGCASLREPMVAASALALQQGSLRLPRMREAPSIPLAVLGELGDKGLHDMQINGKANGPFDVIPHREASAYPMLWRHSAARERRLIVEPDREGRVRPNRDQKALDVWHAATRLHFNRDFRLNSQSLAACLTPERSIGGRAWPNFRLADTAGEEAIALWANTTLGLVSFWWTGGRQQLGRSVMTITHLPELLTLDVRQLSQVQIKHSHRIFADFLDHEFLPANEAYHDPARQALDQAVLIDLLGLTESVLEPLAVLRRQWCAEPTVHGGKSTRPTD